MQPFVPDDFSVPLLLKTEQFLLRPLTMDDVEKDYEAVMSSVTHLQQQFPPQVFGHIWPNAAMTKRQDLADLGWHESEFNRRSSFTYTVLRTDETACIGCVYIFPPRFTEADAEIFLWVRESAFEQGLDSQLFSAVKQWILDTWPFKKVTFPFRES